MLNNLTNFFNLIVGRRIKTQLEPSDLIAVGTKQSPALGDYKPTAIKFSDLQAQVGGLQSVAVDGVTITGDGTLANPLVAVSTPEYTETIVNISSAQILAMGTSPVELLPVPGVGKYYDIDKIIIEKDTFNTPYDLGTAEYIRVRNTGSGTVTVIHQTVLTNNSTQTAFMLNNFNTNNLDFGGTLFETNRNVAVNSGYTLTTNNGTNPTLGDGTLRVKIYHKTITFGA